MLRIVSVLLMVLLTSGNVQAATYMVDTEGAHAFVQFRIQHLGYSWLYGRFDRFSGRFNYDAKHPESASIEVEVDISSIDTGHAVRDNHLRGNKFFAVKTFPTASFKSEKFLPVEGAKNGLQGELIGLLTIKGITKKVSLQVEHVGGGPDPWGGVRQGFSARTTVTLKDFGLMTDLGTASTEAELFIDFEGVKK